MHRYILVALFAVLATCAVESVQPGALTATDASAQDASCGCSALEAKVAALESEVTALKALEARVKAAESRLDKADEWQSEAGARMLQLLPAQPGFTSTCMLTEFFPESKYKMESPCYCSFVNGACVDATRHGKSHTYHDDGTVAGCACYMWGVEKWNLSAVYAEQCAAKPCE